MLCAPGNGGISRDAACFPVNAMDKEGMLALAQEQQVDLVFVAPDDPLAAGMVDFLEAAGIPCFGPNAAAAQIEASKVFSKDLMKKYGIPTAGYEVFADPAAALEYIKAQGKYRLSSRPMAWPWARAWSSPRTRRRPRPPPLHHGGQDFRRKAALTWWWRSSSPPGGFRAGFY